MTALLNLKKNKKEVAKKPVKTAKKNFAHILSRPRITEKATFLSSNGVYVFEVPERSNKASIREAIKAYYNVEPKDVRIVRIPAKVRFVRGKWGKTSAGKKAYVSLPKGKTIEIV